MHFKKIVAGFLSASILATTAIVAPVTVSAASTTGSYTFEKSQYGDYTETTVCAVDTTAVEANDTISFSYETTVDNSTWKIGYVETANWTKNISSAQGASTYTATVQDLMDAAGVDTVSELGSLIAIQVWTPAIGDTITYEFTVTHADNNSGESSEEEEVEVPEGYTLHTFKAPSWNPTSESPDATFTGFSVEGLSPDDTVTVSVEPISAAKEDWAIGMQANIDGSWPSITDDSIVSFEGTIQELMDKAGVKTVEELVWINLQMWNVAIGDQIAYKYEITKAEDEDVEEEIISGETEDKTITYKQVDDATAATKFHGYHDAKGSTEDSNTYAQVSGDTWRIYKLVSLEDLKDKTSASVIVKNSDNGKAVELTTKVVYKKLNDTTTAASKGYAYVVFVIKNVTGSSNTSGYITSDLVWSDIILN